MTSGNPQPTRSVRDIAFIALVVALASVPYLSGLGFYSDDWAWFGNAAMSADQSLIGVFRSMFGENVRMRPVQVLYFAGLYKIFGLDPAGYHLVNTMVLAAGAIFFYGVLRELNEPRRLCLALPIVFALLPHYSTARFWAAAYSVGLSMALYFASVYADLRAWRSHRAGWWKALAVLALVSSCLTYEVFLPLFLALPALLWYTDQGHVTAGRLRARRIIAFTAPNWVGLATVLWFKAATTVRADLQSDDLTTHVRWFIELVGSSVAVGFVDYGVELPVRIWQVARDYFDPSTFIVMGVIGLVVFRYLHAVMEPPHEEVAGPDGRRAGKLRAIGYGLCGSVTFVGGYSIFLTNYNAGVTATGLGNRIAIAGAVGVALCFVGLAEGVASRLSDLRQRQRVFSAFVAFLAASGVMINGAIATFWVDAYDKELEVLAEIEERFPALPPGSTILLDGGCPYHGPAVVFESSWDLRWALILRYRHYELQADVITPNSRVEEGGLMTSLYAAERRYPYGEHLHIYDPRRNLSEPMPSAEAARRYFQNEGAGATSCPGAWPGYAVSIF